ncbi:MAG TPA: hypothetical protein VG269_15780 [Tepidisphaeraceae bacterium]|nr:hypothetical protein [Tepidisphaeraceae bacterium]
MRTIGLLLIASLWAGGCSTPVVNSYRPGEAARLVKVKEEGQYNLYASGEKVPVVCPLLLKGERIGFVPGGSGSVVAIAGSSQWPLPKRRYTWVHLGSDFPVDPSPYAKREPMPLRVVARIARWFDSKKNEQ